MKKGFTLIEMVLVMSVIVIIFLLTLPNIQKTLSVVNNKACDAQLKVVDAAILQYQLEYGRMPTSIEDMIQDKYLSQRQKRCGDGQEIGVQNGQAVQK